MKQNSRSWGAVFLGAFILVILITMGSGEDLKSFEIRLNKDSQSECLKDAEAYQFPLPIISIETRCEPVIGNKPEVQETGVST
jgi:hypothetical protein